jgi:hypothetical protein
LGPIGLPVGGCSKEVQLRTDVMKITHECEIPLLSAGLVEPRPVC